MSESKIFPLRLNPEQKAKIRLVTSLRGDTNMSEWIRRAIENQYLHDMQQFPNVKLRARPDSQVFRTEGEGEDLLFFPIAKTIGNERVFIIQSIGYLPQALGGKMAVRVDTLVDAGEQGFEGRGVVIASDDLMGS